MTLRTLPAKPAPADVPFSAEPPRIQPVERSSSLALSFAQQRLWLLESAEGAGSADPVAVRLRLEGGVDRGALLRALDRLVARHEALRTTFPETSGVPEQRIAPAEEARFHLGEDDLSGEDDAPAALRRLAAEEARAPFDLARGPLVRGRLARLAEDDHVLLVTLHPLVADARSAEVFTRELGALHAAFRRGEPDPLPPPAVQYADYAAWQRRWVEGEEGRRQAGYWKETLSGAPGLLELPTDRPRPARRDTAAGVVEIDLGTELTAGLEALARRHGAALSTTLLAGWATVLARLSGQDEVVVGTLAANRGMRETREVIGRFANPLALRLELAGSPTVAELLGRVKARALESRRHQDLPFEEVVERVRPARSPSHAPVFQVMFTWRDATVDVPPPPGLAPAPPCLADEAPVSTAGLDLSLTLSERDGRVAGGLTYAAALFERATVERHLGYLRRVLEAFVADDGRRVDALPILPEAERRLVVEEWNATDGAVPREACIHELFEAQAERAPGAVAVVYGERSLTYDELNARANRLAHRLAALGAAPETRVGVCLERSESWPVALLAALKAGASYVPLDPAYPPERLAYMLADCGAAVLVTQESLRPLLPAGVPVVSLDGDAEALAALPATAPAMAATPANAAYAIFTSGSTGRPKAVQVTHANAANLFAGMDACVGGRVPGTWLAQASISFDMHVVELLWTLARGFRVVILPQADRASRDERPAALVRRHGVTHFQCTPSLAAMMLAEDGTDALAGLDHLLLGGEGMPVELAARIAAAHPGVLVQMYGPTETTVWSSSFPVGAVDGPVPVGRPLRGQRIYVLDAALRPAPVGVPGELYVGGRGVSRGYLNRPGATAGRFVPDAFGGEPGARLYRTGDLARWRADGTIEFLGRNDFQVKVRGFRIELGEIEARLREHPQVREAVVVAREDGGREKRLVAYVVPDWSRVDDADAPADGEPEKLEAEHEGDWRAAWQLTYDDAGVGTADADADRAFDITGWNSSYTGTAIPAEEMREWVDATVARIRALAPARVLEIGCGTGLLLSRVAPGCERYVGLDFSAHAVARIEALRRERPELAHVEVLRRSADELDGFEAGSFDTVVINSVVQYFPSLEYLARVLEGAARVVRPGGRVFVGDVRDLRLLAAFRTAVETRSAPPSRPVEEWRGRAEQALAREEELVIDPGFFWTLGRDVAAVGRVETLARRGRFRNEMTEFRYDAVLHVGDGGEDGGADAGVVDWRAERPTLDGVRARLEAAGGGAVVVREIPNARVSSALKEDELRRDPRGMRTVEEVRRAAVEEGVDPEALWALGEALGWTVEVRLAASNDAGRVDALFTKGTAGRRAFPAPAAGERLELSAYGTDPLRVRRTWTLVRGLREHLAARLPEYMVPASLVRLDALPLSPNGKLDRNALPAPDGGAYATRPYEAPVGEVETALAEIWSALLNVERVGRRDHFFELGGHSLQAVQVVSRAEQVLGVKAERADLFLRPVLADFARGLQAGLPAPAAARGADEPLPVRATGSERPLFLFHDGTGSVEYAQVLAWQLSPEIPVYALPPLLDAECSVWTIPDMGARFVRMIRSVQPSGPYRLAGHSFGGNLAYEAAVHLAGENEEVEFLGMIDSEIADASRKTYPKPSLEKAFRRLCTREGREGWSESALQELLARPELSELGALIRAGDEAGLFAERHSEERISQLRQQMWFYPLAVGAYTPRRISVPVSFFEAAEQKSATPLSHAWRAFLPEGCVQVIPVPGNHMSVMGPDCVPILGRTMSREIARAAREHERGRGEGRGDERGNGREEDGRMTVPGLLGELHAAGVRLRNDDGKLVVSGRRDRLDGPLLEALRGHKAAILELLARHGGEWAPAAVITPGMLPLVELTQAEIDRIVAEVPGGARNVQDIYPLAPLQEGIFFHHLMAREGDPYLLANLVAFESRGRLDAYLQALQAVVDRHDILRTAVVWEGLREPVQVVWRAAQLPVEELALDPADGDVAEQLHERFHPRRHRIDLTRAPLLRLHVAHDAAHDRWVLLRLMHHLVDDNTSLRFLQAEIEAHLEGRAHELPAPLPFRNYVAQSRLGVSRESHEAYFRALLADVDEPTAPFGVLDVWGDGSGIAEARTVVDGDLSRRLRARAQELGVSAASVFHLAWARVLARAAGRDDVVFGTVLFGRMQGGEGAHRVIGPFINTLPVRVRLDAAGVEASVRAMHEQLAELMVHEHASLALAQRASGVRAPAPLFTSLLNYRHGGAGRKTNPAPNAAPNPAVDAAPGAAPDAARRLFSEERTNYPVTLSVNDGGERGFRLQAKAVASVGAERVCAMVHQALRGVVEALEAAPGRPVSQVEVLPEDERRRVVAEWNATDAAYPRGVCVHELFAARAALAPGAPAVVFGDTELTYAELNARANRLAHHLRGVGVGPDARVAILAERGVEMIVSLLAVLKSGGAYVPLDPAHPAERLAMVIADAGASVVVAQSRLAPRVSSSPAEVVRVEDFAGGPGGDDAFADAAPESGVTPENAAYVIYTSGSTGRPKGVVVTHRGVVNLAHALRDAIYLPRGAAAPPRVAMNGPLTFDTSVKQWVQLLFGAALCPVPEEARYDARAMSRFLAESGVEVLDATPAQLRMLAAEGAMELGPVTDVLVAGEAIDAATWRDLSASADRRFHNLYGPTECTVDATLCRIGPSLPVPVIGRPIANARVYVLDARGEPAPMGVAGELMVGGEGVARGYLGRPALTAERFVPDPFGGEPGTRLYRTGDLGRWRADGTLEYLGRTDFQVKVRGFRIEPGEIEARLGEHAAVREAVVLAREDAAGDRRLVAYVVGSEGADAETLRAHLAARLPDYMVPAAYVRLDALPLTRNGKVDRAALPAPEGDAFAARGYEAPLGETEEALAAIWAELLGVERVGRRDSFFDLGGHSLRAVQVISRVRQALGAEAAVRDLFERPVLADFARGVREAGRAELPPIGRADRSVRIPLSFAQQRLWFLEQMGGVGSTYHIPRRLRLTGELDADALERALDRVVERHEVLRTTFAVVDGEPEQRIAPAGERAFHLLHHDLRGHADADAELRRIAGEEAGASFDLERGPLVRGRLARLADDDHVLLLTLHHVVSDAWSAGVLSREVNALYEAFRRGEPDPLPPLAVQYADYAAWQRRWVDGEVLERQAAYWTQTLSGAPELLELPTDRPRPARQDFAGAVLPVVLDEELTAALAALSRRHGTTPYMTLLAAWSVLLARLSGQGDVVVGTPTANRGRSEVEGLIGFFVNTLALRVEMSDSPSVSALLGRVRGRALEAQQNQDIPFEQVVERVRPARSLAHTPVFQVLFTWQNAPREAMTLAGVKTASVGAAARATAKFDLSLTLSESGGRIGGSLEYATALFDRETVERWIGAFRLVLQSMAADDARPVDHLPILAAGERESVLRAWNATDAAVPRETCVHRLFEAHAARAPEAEALVFEGRAITYGELNARANRLARHLRSLGVGPDARVGIRVERGPEMVAALLAVLKAGGAYLPLDPAYPADRLRHMLDDAAPAALLTERALAGALAPAAVPVVELDADASAWADLPDGDLEDAGVRAGHLAYVIYTSGSTGRPKGVMVEHRNLANHTAWQVAAFGIGAGDTVLQRTSISFDASVWELWTPLAAGARIHLLSSAQAKDPAAIGRAVREGGVTVAQFVPTLLQAVLASLPAGGTLPCRVLFCGGEPLSAGLVAAARAAGAGEVVNLYGPTEATIDATSHVCVADGRAPAIGRPVANARAYVLDRRGEPVPVGVAGELYVGGAGVARGYLERPALTAERFVPDPFANRAGERMYRTGDRARWLSDGTLEYLGRTDFQVKVRGFRIEPGEIEARLEEHPSIREAVVTAREDVPGDQRLVAYVVASSPVEADALRAHLGARLPEHMVPAAYVVLDAFPLTPSGKVDRKALPAPDGEAYARRDYEAPVGETEQALAEIWSEVLKVERVGRWDHFFELGGHSLIAVRVISRVRAALGVEVVLGEVFERPVLADFARGIAGAERSDLAEIGRVDRGGRIPLSFAQQRLWFLEQLGSAGAAYHMAARMRLKGAIDRDALLRTLDRVVARHEALRTTFVAVDGEPEQRITPVEAFAFALAEEDVSGEGVAGLRRVSAEEAARPFDLERGPLVRGRLVRLAEDDHLLIVTLHHIVSDGWSMGVLTRELGALHAAFREGRPDPLPPLPVQYPDYAAWQRRRMEGDLLARQADYWTRTLSGAPELLELPTDHPRPARQDFAGAAFRLAIDEELTTRLRALSRRHGTTLFMTVLAGWSVVLSRLSGQDDVVVGTPTANRDRAEVEGLIGFFVNTLAMRVDLSGRPTVAELLGRVRERALEAQQNQDIPFEQVVELVQPARTLAHSPLFQVMLAWQSTPREAPATPGVEQAPSAAAPGVTAKFDLLLALAESGGRIVGAVEYATSLFERATVERWAGYLVRVLEEMAADDALGADRLPMLAEAERDLVVRAWNATEAEIPREACIHELFEAQVERTPGATALVFEGERLTYAELNARANRLAHHLRSLGVGPDGRVGICVERSVEMVVGLLGILKAGGAYVPLDASYPVERLRNMVEDSVPAVLLTHPPLADTAAALTAGSDLPVIDLADDAAWAGRPETNPGRGGVTPGSLGHVLFTSGSTGRPKGVMLEHGSLVNRLAWMQDRYGMTADEVLLQKTPFSFDVSFCEFFWPLMVGARVVLARPGGHREPAYLADLIQREGITHAHFVPSMLQLFLEHPDAAKCTGLLRVPVSGEAVSAALVRHFHERLPGVELTNQYGPTESGEVTEWRCDPDAERVSIGRAIHNSTVYVLDRAGQPAPVGVAGELFIGGIAVARGYLGRPALTAERFVPDAFGAPGARAYRTGDLCRWTEFTDALTHSRTHALEYLGRTDFQVKVRGFRVELGEIEARLAAHPAVREAVVLALDDGAGGKRLAAYYTADAPVRADALRAHLAEALPEFMIPAALVWMPEFPVTPNGKLDRRALPAPEADAFAASRGYEAPLGEMEEALAAIWSELLGVERVGRRDDFFALGGHSLLAVRVVSRVRQSLGIEAEVGDLFVRPVLADFARGLADAGRADLPPIAPADREGALPLSFAQQRLWFLDRMEGTGSAYHVPTRMRLRGELDRGALLRALDRIVERHEALRTTFPERDGVAEQRIAPAGESRFALAEHDLSGRPDAGRDLARLAAEEMRAPFDLARGPLIRGFLARMAADDHVLLVTMHHIVSDGWSMGVLTRELGALYAAFRQGGEDPLPPLAVQYADYAAWQRRWMEGEVLRTQAEYWKTTLSGAPELLELPTDRSRPARQDFTGATVGLVLDEALTAGLKALGARHGTTLFMTLLAGWATVLSRLSSQDDVVVGTPSANRGRAEIEGLIGFFVNMLPVRVELSDAPTVAELLARVRERALGAQHHQDLPFEQVVELVHPARSMAHAPLFQAMFTWQNAPGGGADLPGLTLAPMGPVEPSEKSGAGSVASTSSAQATANVDLSLTLSERGGRIAGSVTYAAALFDRETVERYAGHLRRVLEGMVADETRRVDRLEIVSGDERRRMVEEWNRTDASEPGETCVHALFEAQVKRAPEADAVVFAGDRLTYAELNAAANRLARRLRAAGVGPEAPVGVMLDRSAELVVALLAVLKSGGAYLPLDPALPAARRAALAADAGAAVLVTRDAALEGFAGRIVSPADVEGEDEGDLGLHVPAAALAYVIYTSGSTGTPKGVGVAHAEAAAHCRAAAAVYGMTPADRVLQFAAVGFDVSLEQMLAPLAAGACVVMRGNEVPTPLELARRAAAQGLTVINPPTAYWHQLAADPDALELLARSVRLVIAGGEAMSPAAAREWASGPAASVRLLNGYGPTETVVTCTGYDVSAALPAGAAHVPVGRPFGGRTAYVLDAWGEPAPLGVPGELCIGGVLARGYLGRPAATAQAFVPDPFSATPGARMYRTGDRARWLAAGELEFLGRRDHQVKVRGFRIELGEIEARLAEHPEVRESVVLAREDAPGDKRLVAYVVGGEGASAEALRAHLGAALPAYMVPSAFVRLDAFPLTPNGKLDRRALPAPEAPAGRAYEAPVGETEEALAEIFAEVLGVERVGRRDNFFELGGHSLLAVRVISRVRQVLEAEVVLAHVFSHPSVESLAARLAGADDGHRSDRAIPIRPTGSQPPLFLASDGTGSILYAQVLYPHIDAEIPVYALPAPAPSEPPLRTVEGMAARLVKMIREVQPAGPYRLAGWSFGGVLAYEVAAQLLGRDEVVEFVGMFDSGCPAGFTAAGSSRAESRNARVEHAFILHVLRTADTTADGAESDEEIADAGDEDLETFVRTCRDEGLLPRHVTVAQARAVRDRLRAHEAAWLEYFPQPIPVLVHQFPAGDSPLADPTRGWGAFHPERLLRVTPVPGTHLSMMRAPNAAALGEALSRALDGAREEAAPRSAGGPSPVVRLQGGAAGAAPLFCVPGAGASVTSFVDLAGALGRSWPILGLQPHGLDGATVPHATVHAAAEHYLRALGEACPAGPVHLLGHSFGGWVALEMALRLHEAGRPVASLTILDSEVPDDSESVLREYGGGEAFLKLVEVVELTAERSLGISPADVASRDEAGWLKLLHGKMVEIGLLGARTTPEVLAGPFRTFARCLRTSYRPSGVYPGRLRLVLVDDPAKDEAANRAYFAEVERGWREWAPGLVFSAGAGNHVTALKQPHVAALAALLAGDRGSRGG